MDTRTLATIDSLDTGPLGVLHLRRLWARTQLEMRGAAAPQQRPQERGLDHLIYDALGLGHEETLRFIYRPDVGYEAFEAWVAERHGGAVPVEVIERTNRFLRIALGEAPAVPTITAADEPALSADDLAFFEQHGYVILHDAVPPEQCRAAERAVWETIGARPDDRESWYAPCTLRQKVMVQLFRHEALEANRRAPRIHRAFAQLWGSETLCCTTDRAGFSPPDRHDYYFPGPFMHWDVDFRTPLPFGLQGILYLTDTPAQQGAFQCVPGFHHRFDEWLSALPPGADPHAQDLDALGPLPIAGQAGDLIIWHHALPHGPTPNKGERPRIVQYLSMYPIGGVPA